MKQAWGSTYLYALTWYCCNEVRTVLVQSVSLESNASKDAAMIYNQPGSLQSNSVHRLLLIPPHVRTCTVCPKQLVKAHRRQTQTLCIIWSHRKVETTSRDQAVGGFSTKYLICAAMEQRRPTKKGCGSERTWDESMPRTENPLIICTGHYNRNMR
jgi:hypothetical protein